MSRVYRVTSDETVRRAMAEQELQLPHQGNEVWMSETTKHSKAFIKGDPSYRSRNVLEIEVDKDWYENMRKN